MGSAVTVGTARHTLGMLATERDLGQGFKETGDPPRPVP